MNSNISDRAESESWNFIQLILFRLTFAYLMLYSLESFIELTQLMFLWNGYRQLWQQIISMLGQTFFHLEPIDSYMMYSGDSVYSYIEVLCLAVVSIAITILWSIFDRKRQEYNKLYSWFQLFMRLFLGASLIGYGWVKVIGTQFPPLDLIRLTRPVGDYSPAGLLWATMGYSYPYGAFGGLVEVVGGMLLLLPQFALAGAVLGLGAMVNVFMFNMCFGIGVKILAFHLLLVSVVLMLPEWKGLLNLFILRRPCQPVSYAPLFASAKYQKLAVILQIFFCLYYVSLTAYRDTELLQRAAAMKKDYAQRGIWIVEEQTIDGTPVANTNNPELRWGKLIFDRGSDLVVQDCTGRRTSYRVNLGENKIVEIERNKTKVGNLKFASSHPNRATMDGTFENKQIHCLLKRTDEKDIVLTSQGFDWMESKKKVYNPYENYPPNR